jgi:hypothetical protein
VAVHLRRAGRWGLGRREALRARWSRSQGRCFGVIYRCRCDGVPRSQTGVGGNSVSRTWGSDGSRGSELRAAGSGIHPVAAAIDHWMRQAVRRLTIVPWKFNPRSALRAWDRAVGRWVEGRIAPRDWGARLLTRRQRPRCRRVPLCWSLGAGSARSVASTMVEAAALVLGSHRRLSL